MYYLNKMYDENERYLNDVFHLKSTLHRLFVIYIIWL